MSPERDPTDTVDVRVRVREPVRAALEAAAQARGISVNAEVVGRLEGTFSVEALLPQALDLQFGRETGAVLTLIGHAIRHTVRSSTIVNSAPAADDAWLDDAWLFEQAVKAVGVILEELRPAGKATPPRFIEKLKTVLPKSAHAGLDELGTAAGHGVLTEAREGHHAAVTMAAPGIRAWLAPVRERLGARLAKRR